MVLILLILVAIVAGLSWYLVSHDNGAPEPVGALWAAAGFGVLAYGLAWLAEDLLPAGLIPFAGISLDGALAVSAIEEGLKFIPLALWLYRRPFFNEHTDGVEYFVVGGLAFGLIENVSYALQYGGQAGIARIVLVPAFHAATAGIVGYYLAGRKLRTHSWAAVLWALIGVTVLHALYDYGLSGGSAQMLVVSLMITLLLSIGCFALHIEASDEDASWLGAVRRRLALPGSNRAIAALVLGVVGLAGWMIPLLGVMMGGLGLILGVSSIHSGHHRMALVGLVLSVGVLALGSMALALTAWGTIAR